MHYVATEVGVSAGCAADVLASDGKNLIEYEIKTSIQDLVKDSEKPKHIIYDPTPIIWTENNGTKNTLKFEIRPSSQRWRENNNFSVFRIDDGREQNISGWKDMKTIEDAKTYIEKQYGTKANTPNMLYYVITEPLWEKHKERIESSLHPSYGVITFTDYNYHGMTVVRKAKKLHKNLVSPEMLRVIAARMSSEIAALSMSYYMNQRNMTEFGKMIENKFDLNELEE